MQLYALDSEFNLITMAIPYEVLQWNRRYYEAGHFLMQIPEEVFDPTWAYIGSKDRPELAMYQKFATTEDNSLIVGGFFCEAMLDECACYPRYVGDVQKTEQAVRNLFTKYAAGRVPIELGEPNDPLMGDRTQSDFSDNELGKKLYSILEPRELSYRVEYDYVMKKLLLGVWQGLDRTQSQNVNPNKTFSLEFGNIADKDVNFDNSDYKNYGIIPCNADDNGKERNTYYLDWRQEGERRRDLVIDLRSMKPEDGQSMANFQQAVLQEATEKLLARQKIEDVDVTPLSGYMVDFDLGDKCDVMLTDLGIEMETRIVQVNETFSKDGHTVSVGLGNKRINRVRRAVNQA